MLLIVVTVLSFLFLDTPWRWVAIGLAVVVEFAEVLFWLGWNHNRKVRVGAETMIGKQGVVIGPCFPDGQVRLDGEIWNARCDEGAREGTEVVVERLDGLVLDVRRIDQ